MKALTIFLFAVWFSPISVSANQTISGTLLHRNELDSSSNTLLFNLYSSSCKNCVYLNEDLINNAVDAGYQVAFCIYGLAKEDLEVFKEENGFADRYSIILDKELSKCMIENSICVLKGKQIIINKECGDEESIFQLLKEEVPVKSFYTVQLDTAYKFYSGIAAYQNERYSVVMDFRHSRRVHKINIETGSIESQFAVNEKQWAEKIYDVIYKGDAVQVAKSMKARQQYLKRDRMFGDQEFKPENITIKEGRTVLTVEFSFPYLDKAGDTLNKNTCVIFQLDDSLKISDYWVAPLEHLQSDFYITHNTGGAKLLFKGDTVFLPVAYIYFNTEEAAKKYNYAKFILGKNHELTFHSFLPFLVPNEKSAIMPDYYFLHMHLLEHGNDIVGSYITFPGIYNLTENTKIQHIDLIGSPKRKWDKNDSVLFANDIDNLKYLVTYFDRYKDKYYLMQAKNATWNTYTLFDNNMNPIKVIYSSPVHLDAGNAFYAKDDILYVLKAGTKTESDLFIHKYKLSSIFRQEID